MEFIFIRHTSVDVESGTCYGQTDVPLRDTFPTEAEKVKEELFALELAAPFDAVYTSPLSRCTRLAEYCGFGDAQRDDRLKETNFGDWEMKKWADINQNQLQQWFDDWHHTAAPNGESFADQLRRVGAAIDDMKKSGKKRIAIFAHGGVICCAHILIDHTPVDRIFSMQPPYGGIVRFETKD